MAKRVNVDQLLIELPEAAREAGFSVVAYGESSGFPLFGFRRPRTGSTAGSQTVYLSGGIHGDEPAGSLALLELLQADALPRHHDYFICPLMNPSGLTQGTRESAEGIDLNRDYRDFHSGEIREHRQWATEHIRALDLAMHLHEDWEASGFYLYELNFGAQKSRAPVILRAANQHLPIDPAPRIDGNRARSGIIRPREIPDIPEGIPEAIFFQTVFGGLNYTLETPSTLPMAARVAALRDATLAALG